MTTIPSSMRAINDFDGARDHSQPLARLSEVRRRGEAFRERFLAEPQVAFYKSINLVRVPYPSWYAYTGVYAQSAYKFPFVHILNRLFVVQYRDFDNVLRTLLFSPSDLEGNRETPFFKRLADMLPGPRQVQQLLAPIFRDVEQALGEIGLRPEQIDYISYDHLHTQDVRRWIGSDREPGFFPNAKLLVHRQEWASTLALLPCQADWYCPGGIAGLPADKVITFDSSVQLGAGVALLHTPGHTEGNHSLVARVADGIRVTSENGVGADAYAPQNSRINAVRRYAKATGMEVILNGNTLEGSNDQYISMVLEKTVAGPSRNPEFPNCATSSECTPSWVTPGHQVSWLMGEAEFGKLATG
ncbi:MAG: hypothetical protein K0Q68_1299 [Moraxellaceae bacterium]|jgi:hypothetical protein|nr:hypothetical protein [Moraxellaceae bacterium]